MQKAGAIRDLKCQVRFDLTAANPYGQIIPIKYDGSNRTAYIQIDFEYIEVMPDGSERKVFEDTKGYDIQMGRLKRAIFKANTGHEIRIT